MTKHYTHEEIQALLDAATPGEWEIDLDGEIWGTGFICNPSHFADTDFISQTPAIIRQLLEEIVHLQQYKEFHDSIPTLPIVTCPDECGNHQFNTGGPMLCCGCEKWFLSDEWSEK